MVDLIRESSRRWSDKISRCRARLFSFTAEEDASESSSLDSWPTSASLFSSSSCKFVSVLSSSSEGFWGMFGAAANCEYVWNSVSVCHPSLALCCQSWLGRERVHRLLTCCSSARACWRACAHPPPVEDMAQSKKCRGSASDCFDSRGRRTEDLGPVSEELAVQ